MQYQKYQLMMELENKLDASKIKEEESDELLQNIHPSNTPSQSITQSNRKLIYFATIIILAILVFNTSIKNRKAQKLQILLDQTQNNIETTSIRSNQQKEEPNELSLASNILRQYEKISAKSYEDDILQFQKQQPQKYKFVVPRKVWIYNASQFSYINELILQNNVKFTRKIYYQLQYVNEKNYQKFLHYNAFTKLSSVIRLLRQRADKEKNDALKMNLNKIIRTIILLNVVHQNGGICTDGESIIVEDFGWIKNIVDNIHATHGRNRILPKVFGFYNPQLSPNKKKFTMKPKAGLQQVDKFKTQIPILQNYFIAAEEKAQFLQVMINKIYEILQNPSNFAFKHLAQYKVKKTVKQMNIYESYFYLSSAIVLQQKQKYLDERFKGIVKHFAIDFYGVYCINQNYGPSKIQKFYPDQLQDGLFNQTLNILAYSSLQEMILQTGKIRYLTRLTPLKKFNQFLNNLKSNKTKAIFEGSFIQKMLFPQNPEKLVVTSPKKYFVNYTNQQWNFLPRIIWVFSNNDKISSTLLNNNIRNYSKTEQFKVRQVNINNLKEYLDDDIVEKFNRLVKNSKHSDIINLQKKLAKLAILYRYGGIFLQNSFLLGDLKWLLNIGQLPSNQVTNRFGYLPKMLLSYRPQQKQINERKIVPISPSKTITVSSLLNYDESFIAVEKDHQLIKEWYDNLFMSLEARQSRPNGEYHFCKELKQTTGQTFDIPVASLLCVLHNRNLRLAESQKKDFMNAEDYYKLWSMNGYVSQQKLISHLNFDNFESDDQVYLHRYSQQYVQGIVGDLKQFITLEQEQMESLQAFAVSNFHNFTAAAHSKSIFSRHLWKSDYKVSKQSRGFVVNIESKQ